MTVTVRPVEPSDCASMPAFRLRMEGGAFLAQLRDGPFYRNKYMGHGRAFVAVSSGEVVGVISAMPRKVCLRGTVVSGAEVGDLFVDPAFRGQGLFRRLHDALVEAMHSEGVRFLTVRPGPEAQPILRKAFGWRTLFSIAEWVAALDDRGVRSLPLGGVPLVRSLLPRWKEEAGQDPGPTTEFTGSVPGAVPNTFGRAWPAAGVVRDSEWLTGRYSGGPTPYRILVAEAEGGPVGVLVVLAHGDGGGAVPRGWLVDGWTAPGDEVAAISLVRRGVAALRDEGASIAHFWCAREAAWKGDPMCVALHRSGFRAFSRGKVVLWRPTAPDPAMGVPGPGDWILRMGDTDGI